MDIEDIYTKICSNPLARGVTFSGGEPFCQAAPLCELAQMIKDRGLELAIYTGYVFEELQAMNDESVNGLIELADIIVDGPFIRARRNLDLKFRGSDNQRIINIKKTLQSGSVVIDDSTRW